MTSDTPEEAQRRAVIETLKVARGSCEISGDHYVYPASATRFEKELALRGYSIWAAPESTPAVEHGCPKCGTVTQPRWHYNDWRLHPTCNERARNESLRLKEPIDGEHLHYICECGYERVAAVAATVAVGGVSTHHHGPNTTEMEFCPDCIPPGGM